MRLQSSFRFDICITPQLIATCHTLSSATCPQSKRYLQFQFTTYAQIFQQCCYKYNVSHIPLQLQIQIYSVITLCIPCIQCLELPLQINFSPLHHLLWACLSQLFLLSTTSICNILTQYIFLQVCMWHGASRRGHFSRCISTCLIFTQIQIWVPFHTVALKHNFSTNNDITLNVSFTRDNCTAQQSFSLQYFFLHGITYNWEKNNLFSYEAMQLSTHKPHT